METLDILINSSIFSVMSSRGIQQTYDLLVLLWVRLSTKWARSWEPYVWNWAESRQTIECSDLPAENGQNVRDGALVARKDVGALEHSPRRKGMLNECDYSTKVWECQVDVCLSATVYVPVCSRSPRSRFSAWMHWSVKACTYIYIYHHLRVNLNNVSRYWLGVLSDPSTQCDSCFLPLVAVVWYSTGRLDGDCWV